MWGNCKEVRGFFGRRGFSPPLVSTHPSPSSTTRWSHIPLIGPQLNSTYRSLEKEGKRRGEEVGKFFFPPRPYFFPLCSILEGIVLKISWHWRDTRSWLISRPTLLHPIDNGTLNRLLPFYDPLPQLLDRTYVPLTFFLITPINFSSVETEDIPLVE